MIVKPINKTANLNKDEYEVKFETGSLGEASFVIVDDANRFAIVPIYKFEFVRNANINEADNSSYNSFMDEIEALKKQLSSLKGEITKLKGK